jgi:hypothetical protein
VKEDFCFKFMQRSFCCLQGLVTSPTVTQDDVGGHLFTRHVGESKLPLAIAFHNLNEPCWHERLRGCPASLVYLKAFFDSIAS